MNGQEPFNPIALRKAKTVVLAFLSAIGLIQQYLSIHSVTFHTQVIL